MSCSPVFTMKDDVAIIFFYCCDYNYIYGADGTVLLTTIHSNKMLEDVRGRNVQQLRYFKKK